MAIIKELNGCTPVIGERAFVAESAAIIGNVSIGEDCSIWYGAVLRGDVGAIRMGNYSNVQDNAILHATYGESEAFTCEPVVTALTSSPLMIPLNISSGNFSLPS